MAARYSRTIGWSHAHRDLSAVRHRAAQSYRNLRNRVWLPICQLAGYCLRAREWTRSQDPRHAPTAWPEHDCRMLGPANTTALHEGLGAGLHAFKARRNPRRQRGIQDSRPPATARHWRCWTFPTHSVRDLCERDLVLVLTPTPPCCLAQQSSATPATRNCGAHYRSLVIRRTATAQKLDAPRAFSVWTLGQRRTRSNRTARRSTGGVGKPNTHCVRLADRVDFDCT